MPIYMDRHYAEGATHEAVAEAHQLDLALQDEFGIRLMTYWFDEQRSTAFCLIDAPDVDAVKKLHGKAHGLIPHEIIEVDPSLVESFLGRIEDPEAPDPTAPVDSAFRTIMFTDIEGSTKLTASLGDDAMVAIIRAHNEIVRNALRANRGSEIKFTGDGFHAAFSSVSDAVRCAITIQQAFRDYCQKHPEQPLAIKIGLSAGEPVEADRDLFGSAVNLAARLCAHATGNQILATQVIKDLCLGKPFCFEALAATRLDGFAEPQPVLQVDWESA